jgi:hypothetical protein
MRDDCGAIEEPIRAQKALRDLAGLGTEMFPVEAFVGMPRLTGTGVNRLKHLAGIPPATSIHAFPLQTVQKNA